MIGLTYSFALNNPTDRRALIANPKALLAELSDDDLNKVAGGKSKRGDSTGTQNKYTCNDTKGIGTSVEVELNIGAEEIAKKYFTVGKA